MTSSRTPMGDVKKETVSTERMADRMQLWFFRDLSDEQRVKLLRLCFYPATEFATHGSQQIAFRTLLSALEPSPLYKEGEAAKHSDECGCGYCT